MKARILITGLIAAALATPLVYATGPNETSSAKPAHQPLSQGMTAEEVIRIVGKAAEIRKMDTPTKANAEIWTYRRFIRDNVSQVAVKTTDVPAWLGPMAGDLQGVGTTPEPDYRLAHVRIYQMTALLMVDGKLAWARQWQEADRSIEN